MYSCTLFQNPDPLTHTSPTALPVYTTSTDVDVPCKNEFLFSFFFFRSHFPLGTIYSLSVFSARVLTTSSTNGKGSTRSYIYARIISDGGGGGEGCSSSGRMAARSRGFCRGEETRGLFDGEVDGEHALVYTCGRVGGEWYDITTTRLFYRPAENSPYLIHDIEICHFKKSCLFILHLWIS